MLLNQTLYFLQMSLAQVKEILFESNLNFDLATVKEVHQFLHTQIEGLDLQQFRKQTLAAAAIVSAIKQNQTETKIDFSRSCIGIQNVLGHLQQISKEQFLKTVQQYIEKSNKNSSNLMTKIKVVQISYRFFKKFRNAFQQLWRYAKLGKFIQNDTLSIFWIVYLFIKNQDDSTYQNIQHQLKVLICLVKSIFQYLFAKLDQSIINSVVISNFADPSCVSQGFFFLYHTKFEAKLNQIYEMRYSGQKIQFQKFSKNAILIARILDDISTQFQKEKENFEITNYIDEISYLQLKKTMTPKGIRILPENFEPISRTLKFQNCQSSSEQDKSSKQPFSSDKLSSQNFQRSLLTSNLQAMTPFRQKFQVSPIRGRIANLQWVNNCIQSYCKSDQSTIIQQILYNYVHYSFQQYEGYEKWVQQKVNHIIQQYSPKCIDKVKRFKQLYAFFKSFILKIFQSYQQEQKKTIFKSIMNLNSILCLATDMFNYAHSTIVPTYKQYCDIYQISLVDAFKPINWIGKNIQKPKEMDKYLYNLEKKIVVKQLWENDVGYQLINSAMLHKENVSINYYDYAILVRLHKHVSDRVQQLCNQVKIQSRLIKRVQNLVKHLIQNKPHLLKKNKIDQIIICGITSFLTINQIQQKQTLEKVFNCYNKLQLSYNSNKEGMSGDHGQSMSLVQFYNQIFLPQIQENISSNSTPDFLLTPIRDIHTTKMQQIQNITPFKQKYRFNGQINPLLISSPMSPSINFKSFFSPTEKSSQNHSSLYRNRLIKGFLKTNNYINLNKNDQKIQIIKEDSNVNILNFKKQSFKMEIQNQVKLQERELSTPTFREGSNFSFGKRVNE